MQVEKEYLVACRQSLVPTLVLTALLASPAASVRRALEHPEVAAAHLQLLHPTGFLRPAGCLC